MKKFIIVAVVLLLVSQVTYGQACYNSGNDRIIEGKDVTYGEGGTITVQGGNTAEARGGSIILEPGNGMNHVGNVILTRHYYRGRVGIGTENPQSKLAVNGKITAKEVKVTLDGWSDFVFGENYQLMPLDKLAHYIEVNKSLPGIPKEEEVVKEGVALGEMQVKLLEKIEELTLYVIELKEENEELKERISALEK